MSKLQEVALIGTIACLESCAFEPHAEDEMPVSTQQALNAYLAGGVHCQQGYKKVVNSATPPMDPNLLVVNVTRDDGVAPPPVNGQWAAKAATVEALSIDYDSLPCWTNAVVLVTISGPLVNGAPVTHFQRAQ